MEASPRYAPEVESAIDRAMEELSVLTGFCERMFGISEAAWWLDQEAGTIVFTAKDGTIATYPVQVVGTLNVGDGTWLWAWDHPSIEAPLRAHAETARSFGEKHGVARFTERKFACNLDEAWLLTAVACHLNRGQGAYCCVTEGPRIFVTFADKVVLRKNEPNKAPEPTPVPVMPRACSRPSEVKHKSAESNPARATPGTGVAHL